MPNKSAKKSNKSQLLHGMKACATSVKRAKPVVKGRPAEPRTESERNASSVKANACLIRP